MRDNAIKRAEYYMFPTDTRGGVATSKTLSIDGWYLNNVMSSLWPFTGADLSGISSWLETTELTNADVICELAPETAPYTYDDLDASDE